MSTSQTVPMIAPDGSPGDIPFERMMDARKAGFKPAVVMTTKDGKAGYIPTDRMQDAVKAGLAIAPIHEQDTQHPGAWAALRDDLAGMAKGTVPQSLMDAAAMVVPGVGGIQQGQQLGQDDAARKAEGRSATYRTVAPIAQVLTGVNARGMEQSANEGDVGGVMGHAAAPLAVLAATEGAVKGGSALADTAAARAAIDKINNLTPKQAGQVIGGGTGAVAGHGTLSAPGAYYGAKTGGTIVERVLGKDRANTPFAGKPVPPTPPPPVPEVPLEVQQAASLSEGGKSPVDPSAGLGQIPVKAVHQAIQELGTKASIPDITTRAQAIAKLGDLLNDGLGGKGLEPNVPLRDQGKAIPKTNIPEGHSPVESSALKSYKYDPAAREFEYVTNDGSHYIRGDVAPEAAAKFEQDAKAMDSYGKAWHELRKNPQGGTPVAKVINGKRVPIRPVISPEDYIPQDEWEAGHALDTAVEGSRR